LQRKKLLLREDCPFDEAYDKIKKLKKFENLSESNIREGYSILKELIKEKPIVDNNDNNSNNNDGSKNNEKGKNENNKNINSEIREKKEENISIKNEKDNN
jgi:hypothetical protein